MNTRQVGVLRIMIIMMTRAHVDVELHGRSHVTFYFYLCFFVDLVSFLRSVTFLHLGYVML